MSVSIFRASWNLLILTYLVSFFGSCTSPQINTDQLCHVEEGWYLVKADMSYSWEKGEQHGYYRALHFRALGDHAADNVQVQKLEAMEQKDAVTSEVETRLKPIECRQVAEPGYAGIVTDLKFDQILSPKKNEPHVRALVVHYLDKLTQQQKQYRFEIQ